MHQILTIDASPKQLSKLRNGHAVRIKKGTGFNLIVNPSTYNLVTKAFMKDKGFQVQLSPEEIEFNRGLSPEMHMEYKKANPDIAGQGIFGHTVDKYLAKHGLKKLAYKFGDEIKPLAKAGILAGLSSGATALGVANPALIPYLAMGTAGLTNVAYDYIDNPNKYHGKSGLKQVSRARTLAGQVAQAKINEKINEELGTNYDYMGRAGLEQAMAAKKSMDLENQPLYGSGLGVGLGAGLGVGLGRYRTADRIMGRGNMQGNYHMMPAMQSQPAGENFQFQYFFPPAYQHIGGKGLYL
jgi:hypothetical protein